MLVHLRNLFLLSTPVAQMRNVVNSKVGKQTKRYEIVIYNHIETYIRLESTSCLFVAYCHEFLNSKSCDGFALPVENGI